MQKIRQYAAAFSIIAFIIILFILTREPSAPPGAISVSELMERPVFDTELKVFGKVSGFGEFLYPCLYLSHGGKKINVWYEFVTDERGMSRPAENISFVENGQWLVVTGELKEETFKTENQNINIFWASSFENTGNYTLEFGSFYQCETECKKKGFDTGECRKEAEVASLGVRASETGPCVIQGSRSCASFGQCSCFCW